jgi:hypothetical protein
MMGRPSAFWLSLVLLHLLRIHSLFGSFGALLSDEPIMNGDYPFQAYHAQLGIQSLKEHGSDRGYDPFFLAGYPKTPHFCASVLPFEVAALVCPGSYRGPKLVVVLVPLIWLWGMVVALSAYQAPPVAVRLGAVLALCLYWLSMPLLFTILGMIGFLMGIALATAAAGLLDRALAGGPWIPFALVAAAAVNIHPHGLVLTFIQCGALLAFSRQWRAAALASAWLLIVSAPYVWRLWSSSWVVELGARTSFWAYSRPFEPFYYYLDLDRDGHQAGALELVLLMLAVLQLRRDGRRARPVGLALSSLFMICFYGSNISYLASIQPVRLTAALAYLSAVPAAMGLAHLWERGGMFERGAVSTCAVVLLALVGYGYFPYSGVLRVGYSPTEKQLLVWLKKTPVPPGRILIEDSYDGGHLGETSLLSGRIGPLLPLLTGREFIGGPMDPYIRHAFANACDGMGFGGRLDERNLEQVFKDYGISTALVWSHAAYRALKRLRSFQKVGRVGRLVCFAGPEGRTVLAGRAHVRASWNLIQLSEIHPEGGRVVLAYHHDPDLVVDPPARLAPVKWGLDPVPFMAIENPGSSCTIRFARNPSGPNSAGAVN